jgi:hypothetical protein
MLFCSKILAANAKIAALKAMIYRALRHTLCSDCPAKTETKTMNAPLPEHIRKALETVTLDEKPRSGFHRRYKYPDSKAGCAVFVIKRDRDGAKL